VSALVALLPLVPVTRLHHVGLRARLARAERAVDRRFTRAASLQLDRAVGAYETARDRSTPRHWRRDA
jgi:hypothetical protein